MVRITGEVEGEAVELCVERGARASCSPEEEEGEEEEDLRETPDLVSQETVTSVICIFRALYLSVFFAENVAPRRANGVTPPTNPWTKPNDSPKGNGNTAWGANNNGWSPSEMGQSAKPPGESTSNQIPKDDSGEDDNPLGTPAAQDWSKSEINGGSQADPWSKPGGAGNKSNGEKAGWGKTPKPGPVGRGAPVKPPVNSAWGNTWGAKDWTSSELGQDNNGSQRGGGGAKDWTPSELGLNDSVSQRGGGGFRTPPTMEPGKKSWAEQVDEEYGSGDEPAPMVAPAPDLEGDGDGDEDEWVESGKRKAKGKAKGKAKSTTGWSDVTNQGHW